MYLFSWLATSNTSKLRSELSWSTFSLVTATVVITVATITTGGTVGAVTDLRGTGWANSLFVGGRDNFLKKVQVFTEVLDTFWGAYVVVPLP